MRKPILAITLVAVAVPLPVTAAIAQVKPTDAPAALTRQKISAKGFSAAPAQTQNRLPVKRVVLYKNGIG